MTLCNICGSGTAHLFTATVRSKHLVNFFSCPVCSFVQTEKPYWLSEVYTDPISSLDTGVLQRNISLSRSLYLILRILTPRSSRYLDYAGGYGILTRLMRDFGLNYEWFDPFTENLFSRGFESPPNPLSFDHRYSAITAIECIEHLENPLSLILSVLSSCNLFVFSTELVPIPDPGPSWWYFMLDRGGHISFLSRETLQYISKRHQLHYSHIGPLHIISRYPLSPLKLHLSRILLRLRVQHFFPVFSTSLTRADHQHLSSVIRG